MVRTNKDLVDNSINSAESILKSAGVVLSLMKDMINEHLMLNVNSIEELIDLLVYKIPFEAHVKQYYLSLRSLQQRVDTFYEDIKIESQKMIIENDINSKLKQNLDESQKNYYLKEKMKVLKEELGEDTSNNDVLDNLEKRINEKVMPDGLREKLKKK